MSTYNVCENCGVEYRPEDGDHTCSVDKLIEVLGAVSGARDEVLDLLASLESAKVNEQHYECACCKASANPEDEPNHREGCKLLAILLKAGVHWSQK